MKFEAKHHARIHYDPLLDIQLLKKSFNSNCLEINQDEKLTGFVQDIVADPFGFLFFSQIQVTHYRFYSLLIIM